MLRRNGDRLFSLIGWTFFYPHCDFYFAWKSVGRNYHTPWFVSTFLLAFDWIDWAASLWTPPSALLSSAEFGLHVSSPSGESPTWSSRSPVQNKMLCDKCSNIHLKRLEEPHKIIDLLRKNGQDPNEWLYYFHYKSPYDMHKSAKDGCHFCAIVQYCLDEMSWYETGLRPGSGPDGIAFHRRIPSERSTKDLKTLARVQHSQHPSLRAICTSGTFQVAPK